MNRAGLLVCAIVCGFEDRSTGASHSLILRIKTLRRMRADAWSSGVAGLFCCFRISR